MRTHYLRFLPRRKRCPSAGKQNRPLPIKVQKVIRVQNAPEENLRLEQAIPPIAGAGKTKAPFGIEQGGRKIQK